MCAFTMRVFILLTVLTTTISAVTCVGPSAWGVIQLDSTSTAGEVATDNSGVKTTLNVNKLVYKYNECVDPATISIEVFEKDSSPPGNCVTTKSLAAHVPITGTKERTSSDMTLSIDSTKVNANSLGTAYAHEGTTTTLTLCLRATVRATSSEASEVVLFVEDVLTLTYSSITGFSSTIAVEREASGQVAAAATLPDGTVEAFQCDANSVKVDSPAAITQANPTLRFCIKTTNTAVACDGFTTAKIIQAANSLDTEVVKDGVSQSAFVEVSKSGQTCMMTSVLTAKYFSMPASNSNLELTISGIVEVVFVSDEGEERRRLLSMAAARSLQVVPDEEGSAEFDIIAAVDGTDGIENEIENEIDVEVDGATSLMTGGIMVVTMAMLI